MGYWFSGRSCCVRVSEVQKVSDFFSTLDYFCKVRAEIGEYNDQFQRWDDVPEDVQAHYNKLQDLANELAVDVRKYADRFEFPDSDNEVSYMSTSASGYEMTNQPIRYAEFAAKMICTDIVRAGVKHRIVMHQTENDTIFEIRVKLNPKHLDVLRMRSGTGLINLIKMIREAGLDPRVFYPMLPDGV